MFEVSSLPDGKSKDLLTMKQDKEEWMEYDQVMEHVVEKSGLDKSIFYDLRGNHDNFGVPAVGGPLDYFSNYSLNGNKEETALSIVSPFRQSPTNWLYSALSTCHWA
ncbi:hypothetical protein ACET3Z_031823 [Daucus carota]